jgi:peptide/nickel transport system permease protein
MAIPILLGVTVIIFLLMTVLPGDPAQAFLAADATPAERAAVRHELGLDRALPVRYAAWIGDFVKGDMGWSPFRRRDVSSLLAQAWVNTAILASFSAATGLAGGMTFGIIAARRRGKLADRIISFFTLVGLSVPSFFVAIVMLIIFSANLGWLPSAGTGRGEGPLVFFQHLLMPMIAGSLGTLAVTSRVTRASIVETYGADFVQTLRAKGLKGGQILRHVFKNAISPVMTTSGLQIGNLLGGAVLIETIFRWPGIGTLVYGAITARDLLVVQGATLVIALTFVLMNLLVDLGQATIDPRLRRAVL